MTICNPRAQGVPGLSTAPNWFDATTAGHPPVRTEIDDPRWTGAYSVGFGDGTGLEAQFRGLYMDPDWRGKKSLFLAWNVVFDASLDNGIDRLYVGFNNGGAAATDTLVLRIIAYNDSSADIVAGALGSVDAFNLDSATGAGVALGSAPPWLADTKVWLVRLPIGWTVHMYVPYDPGAAGLFSNAGIRLPEPFRFFFQIFVKTPTRVSGTAATGGLVVHKWPPASAAIFSGLAGDVYPNPPATAWESFHNSTGAGDPMCPAAGGVTIDAGGLGNMVDNGAPNIIIRYRQSLPRPVNTMFANINNATLDGAGNPQTIPVGGITARFRIADWGSVIMDPAAPWHDVRGGGSVSNAVPIPPGKPVVTAGNPPPLHFDWTLNDAEIAPYLAGKPSDQCILVELTGAGIQFFSDSARQNHLILPASEIRRKAQISIEGLVPISGGGTHRDVYVAVETRNMPPPPKNGGDRGSPPTVVWDAAKIAQLRRRDLGNEVIDLLVNQGLIAALDSGRLRYEQVADLAPVQRVHVYHDTGQQLAIAGVRYPILAVQASFGLIPDHVGPLTGWQHRLEFPSGALQEAITSSFFRVHVPNNGKIDTIVQVAAVEPGTPPRPMPKLIPWWAWLLLLLLLLILIVLRK